MAGGKFDAGACATGGIVGLAVSQIAMRKPDARHSAFGAHSTRRAIARAFASATQGMVKNLTTLFGHIIGTTIVVAAQSHCVAV